MKANVKGLPIMGYHVYQNRKAQMIIKLLGLFPVVNKSGEKLDSAETVTLFIDMCIMTPATLIDKRIQWEKVNDTMVRTEFTASQIQLQNASLNVGCSPCITATS